MITIDKYNSLDALGKLWYEPVYASYSTKKVRSYESCDLGYEHFMGWVEETTPVGEPVHYTKVGVFEYNIRIIQRMVTSHIIDATLNSNILMERILKSPSATPKKGEKV